MSDKLKTIKVKYNGSFKIINESDFDKNIHEIYDDNEKPRKPTQRRTKAK